MYQSIVKFEPSGTSIEGGLLRARLDLRLHGLSLNHFVTIPEVFSLDDLEGYAHAVFDKNTVATLARILRFPRSAHYVSPLMRGRGRFASKRVSTRDAVDLINSINERFKNLAVPLEVGGKSYPIQPQSIDIGAGAVTRGYGHSPGFTVVELTNPANATGTLDTVQVYPWPSGDLLNFYFGTAYGSGTSYTIRASANMGTVVYGSVNTFTGKSISVQSGDFAAYYWASGGQIYQDHAGGSGLYYVTGEYIDPGDSNSGYTLQAGYMDSVYATGTEAAAGGGSRGYIIG